MNPFPVLFLGLVALFAGAAQAAPVTDRVTAVDAQGTVTLAAGGRARFAEILFPDAALVEPWMAQHALQQTIVYEPDDTDRYGRTLITADLERAMLADGVAVLFNQQEVNASWVAAERAARLAKRGVWGEPDFVLSSGATADHRNGFHVVEGTITAIYDGRKATYLNFGDDWHTDFSVTIAGRERRSFRTLIGALHEGSHVRVRGAIYEENGPMIRVMRPEQLEII